MHELTFTGKYEIDFDAEEKRINELFEGDTKARLLNVVDLFKQEKFNDGIDAYDSLPYAKEEECPEQEFMGIWFSELIDMCLHGKYDASDVRIKQI